MARGAVPGRLLVVSALVVAVLYGLVALGGQWTPRLGLDLVGGSRLTLAASGDASVADLSAARDVVAARLEDAGVGGAQVRTSEDGLVVEVPRGTGRDVLASVARPAELQVRVVAASRPAPATPDQPPAPDASASPSPSPSASPTGGVPTLGGGELVEDPVAWARDPDQESVTAFGSFTCPPEGGAADPPPAPDRPVIACDDAGVAYLLSAAVVQGEDLTGAEAVLPAGQTGWGVQLDLDGESREDFAEMSRALVDSDRSFALLVDGEVLAAPRMSGVVADGRPRITTGLGERESAALATSLRYGALPASFAADPELEPVAASLPADRLGGGLLAGLVALVVIAAAAVTRHRLLGLVAPLALVVAAAVTYALLLLLGRGVGLTLTVAALAALAVLIGLVLASASLVLEAVRDGRRGGASPSVAVAHGVRRAGRVALVADAVVAGAAVVLYVVGAGPLDGFAALLLLAAVVDLVVRLGVTGPGVAWSAGRDRLRRLPAPSEADGRPPLPVVARARTWYVVALAATALGLAGLLVRPLDLSAVTDGAVAADTLGQAAVDPAWADGTTARAAAGAAAVLVLVLVALAGWTRRWQAALATLAVVVVTGVVTSGLLAWVGLAVTPATLTGGLAVLVLVLASAAVVLGAHAAGTRGTRGRLRHRDTADLAARRVLAWPAATAAAVAVPALAVLVAAAAGDTAREVTSAALVLLAGTTVGAWSTVFVLVPVLVQLEERDPAVRESDRRAVARRKEDRRKEDRRDVVRAGPARAPAKARGPVRASGSARRQQPTRTTRSKRGRK